MPANEFEKQVQKQLGDFQLNPSASVWKKVEDQIQKKKRRRVLFFFLFSAAFLLLGYYGYHLLQTNKKTEIVQLPVESNNEKLATNDKKSTSEETKVKPASAQSPETNKQGASVKKEVKQKRTAVDAVNNDLQVSSANPFAVHKQNKRAIKQTVERTAVQHRPGVSPANKTNRNQEAETKLDVAVSIAPPAKSPGAKNEITESSLTEKDIQTGEAVTKDAVPVKSDSIKTSDVAAADDKKDVIAKKKDNKFKIKWGIDFSAGITSNQSHAFPLLGPTDRSYAANYVVPSATTGVPAVIIPPSSIKPGAAFRIGLTGELPASARSSFSAGLQYSYASNRIDVGTARDTSLQVQSNGSYPSLRVNKIYQGARNNNYSNSYHLISLPLEFHWLAGKSKNVALQWNAGVSVSYLAATNALVYSPSYGGIYYRDNGAINKLYFNIGTGLSFRLKGKSGMEWALGPEILFGTRKLVNNQYDAKQYSLFSGINTKIFFPKKKK